ncbi:urease accessory protein UreD [Usitatibacter palustris]|uniref:Urease accessory protein UreD n=1 Tax=Usitatibacter palustris TaxID=2732487 RepID=A0A6M4HBT9_9PROT|nr:urease accessory protein UreD [Usitatibacter palustris]QJR15437.1 Urease accessory protein UreD [Usitatibacter palustris]
MLLAEPVLAAPWRAELALEFERRAERTVLASRRHDGPLVFQKPLYPEGDAICHGIIVHPPAGIAGGDELHLHANVGEKAHALLTTPGAAKWYRSAGARASSDIRWRVANDAALEWLPQETIIFSGALAAMTTLVSLTGTARYLGWEILCLGRTGSGERFDRGEMMATTEIERDGKPIFIDRLRVAADGAMRDSPAGLAGSPVSATFVAAAEGLDAALVTQCRDITPPVHGEGAITRLPGVVVARYLGTRSDAAREWFTRLWTVLRPAILQREAIEPRIWRT